MMHAAQCNDEKIFLDAYELLMGRQIEQRQIEKQLWAATDLKGRTVLHYAAIFSSAKGLREAAGKILKFEVIEGAVADSGAAADAGEGAGAGAGAGPDAGGGSGAGDGSGGDAGAGTGADPGTRAVHEAKEDDQEVESTCGRESTRHTSDVCSFLFSGPKQENLRQPVSGRRSKECLQVQDNYGRTPLMALLATAKQDSNLDFREKVEYLRASAASMDEEGGTEREIIFLSWLFHAAARGGMQSYFYLIGGLIHEEMKGRGVRSGYPWDMSAKSLFAQAAVGGHVDLIEHLLNNTLMSRGKSFEVCQYYIYRRRL